GTFIGTLRACTKDGRCESVCCGVQFFFSSRRRHTSSVSAFLLNRSSDLVKDCVTIDVLPRTPGNNVYVGFMVWSNFTATKCRGLVSLNQVIKEIICLQPLK